MSAGRLLKQANQLKRMGKLDEAIALYHQVIEINPHFAWAHYNLGEVLAKQGNVDEAVFHYRHSLEVIPNSPWFLYTLGEALSEQGDLEGAVKYFLKAIEIKPNFYKFYQSLGHTLTQEGKFDQAITNYHQAINLNPHTANSYVGCCIAYIHKGDLSRGYEYIEQAIQLSPTNLRGEFYHEFIKTINKLGIKEKISLQKNISNAVETAKNYSNDVTYPNQYIRKILKSVENYLNQVYIESEIKSISFHRVHRCLSEMILPGGDYLDILKKLHFWLRPTTYVEIGVENGRSFRLSHSSTISIGIDPQPKFKETRLSAKVFALTSNEFFQKHDILSELNGNTIDLGFIDGLHWFEQSLQDFINLEKYSHKQTIICFHDTLPLDQITSNRDFLTMFWSGDVWKVVPILKQYRPDLEIFTIATKPTGLTMVSNLDPHSTVLSENYDAIVNEYMNKEWIDSLELRYAMLSVVSNNWQAITQRLKNRGR